MKYVITAKSRGGWGVAIDGDVVGEHPDLKLARADAEALRAAAKESGSQAEVLDLSDANVCGALLPGRGVD